MPQEDERLSLIHIYEEKRSNQNYEIIESCTIGSTELVIGHNPNAPNPYAVSYTHLTERTSSFSTIPYGAVISLTSYFPRYSSLDFMLL